MTTGVAMRPPYGSGGSSEGGYGKSTVRIRVRLPVDQPWSRRSRGCIVGRSRTGESDVGRRRDGGVLAYDSWNPDRGGGNHQRDRGPRDRALAGRGDEPARGGGAGGGE